MKQIIRIHPQDNVAVALQDLQKGTTIDADGHPLALVTDIPAGHKVALRDIGAGDDIIKYGFPIGHARHPIAAGAFLDHHDIATNLQGELNYDTIHTDPAFVSAWAADATHDTLTFSGYLRADGQVGIRNDIWVVPTVGCVNGICQRMADRARGMLPSHPRFLVFPHNYGCSQLGDDLQNTRKVLRDLVLHPNHGGLLVVGLGCENNQPHNFMRFCEPYDTRRVRLLVCQEADGDEVEAGARLLVELYRQAQDDRRTPQPLQKLRVGLKCGGSDGFSGITANPLVGAFSDWLCRRGGTTVLTEVPEMFGAETILMRRCATDEVLEQTKRLINDFKRYFLSHHQPVGENPSPGNKAGGISTLEEKALGCTQKAGSSPVRGVVAYGDRLRHPGLNLLSAPGNDLVAATALAAAGCQLVLFTTGRGTPFATCVPTVKVATNTRLYRRKPQWIDFNAGSLVDNDTIPSLLPRFISTVMAIVGGQPTMAERAGIHGIAIFKDGVTL